MSVDLTRSELIELFDKMYPDYFSKPWIRSMNPEYVYDEMILDLKTFSPDAHSVPAPDGIVYGMYDGDPDKLRESVGLVDEDWVKYYGRPGHAYVALDGDRVVSFCDVSDFGTHTLSGSGRVLKMGGPGCVGTIPEYRRKGIGLKMVLGATAVLKERGFDYSFIHYTGVGPWYSKLGYETVLRWNCRGFVD